MARMLVHYLMATLFMVLVMISSNSVSCLPCSPPGGVGQRDLASCFKALNNICTTNESCVYDCQLKGHTTYNAYCKPPKKSQNPQEYLCCCPP
ncbi:unnamed protein product [Urochloa decumbens]|uniref:Uncharacterized protein n=1 Tax=Urochloa decumbens TaxID=240449 RepID=A0ABC9H5Y8_9POAL